MKKSLVAAGSAAILLLAPASAPAADEHERARRAFEAGEIVGLAVVLSRVRSAYEGQVIEIELDERRWSSRRIRWVYAVRVLTPRGNVLLLRLNAKTVEILDVEGRGADIASKRR